MKNRITKFAAAAVIIIALGLIWTFNGAHQLATSAYAVGQSITACHTVRTIHVKAYDGKEMIENNQYSDIWIRFDDSGMLTGYRTDTKKSDGSLKSIVWDQHVMKIWTPDKNTLMLEKGDQMASTVERLAAEFDPKQILQLLKDLQREKKIELVIHESSQLSDPIVLQVMGAGSSSEMGLPENARLEFSVNADTKLLERFIRYRDSEGKLEPVQQFEFLSYNEPIEPSLFELTEVPDDAKVIDRTKPVHLEEMGMAQGDKSINEIAVTVVREYFEALIAGDFAKAKKLSGGFPVSFVGIVRNNNVVGIASLGQPEPHEKRKQILVVPCQLYIENQTGGKQTIHLDVRTKALKNQPDRWIVCSQ
ncbi:MAG: hypothetical protein GY845_26580 [Planctomycetes bacterium]|nr:hypothetical protein [Planctomycetota bacterium]